MKSLLLLVANALNVVWILGLAYVLIDEGLPRRTDEMLLVFIIATAPFINLICLNMKFSGDTSQGFFSSWISTARMRTESSRLKAEAELNALKNKHPN